MAHRLSETIAGTSLSYLRTLVFGLAAFVVIASLSQFGAASSVVVASALLSVASALFLDRWLTWQSDPSAAFVRAYMEMLRDGISLVSDLPALNSEQRLESLVTQLKVIEAVAAGWDRDKHLSVWYFETIPVDEAALNSSVLARKDRLPSSYRAFLRLVYASPVFLTFGQSGLVLPVDFPNQTDDALGLSRVYDTGEPLVVTDAYSLQRRLRSLSPRLAEDTHHFLTKFGIRSFAAFPVTDPLHEEMMIGVVILISPKPYLLGWLPSNRQKALIMLAPLITVAARIAASLRPPTSDFH